MKMNFSIPAIALFAGAALGYVCGASSSGEGSAGPAPQAAAQEAAKPHRQAKTSLDADASASLRARIKELEKRLAEAKAGGDGPQEEKTDGGAAEPSRRRRRMNPFDFAGDIEKFRKENPEAYAQMTNGMARMNRRRKERAASRMDFFASVDTTGMDRQAVETHESLQKMLQGREELASKMESSFFSGDGGADHGEMMGEMFRMSGEIRELMAKERENLLLHTAKTLGFEGEAAGEIVATVQEIYESTSDGWGGRGRGRGGERP